MNKHHHLNFTVTSLIFWLTLPFFFLRFLLICQNPVGVILIRSFMSVLFLIFYKWISDGSLSFTKILSREKLMFKWVMSLCLYVGKVPFERSYVPLLACWKSSIWKELCPFACMLEKFHLKGVMSLC